MRKEAVLPELKILPSRRRENDFQAKLSASKTVGPGPGYTYTRGTPEKQE
jgi:hypothetical protein